MHALLTAALLLLALTGSTLAEQLKVVSISDGDTFTGLDSQNRQIKVRLHGIDAPEKVQAFGNVSRKALGDLIEGKVSNSAKHASGIRAPAILAPSMDHEDHEGGVRRSRAKPGFVRAY